MTWSRPSLALLSLASAVVMSAALALAAPPPRQPEGEARKAIEERLERLRRGLDTLRRQGVRDPSLADIEVYHKAVVWVLRHGELPDKEDADRALAVLDRGLLRAGQQARGEAPWLEQRGQAVARAYRSRV